MNKIIVAVFGLVMVVNAYASYGQKTPDATENDITTSQAYVDTALANTQNTIPAKSGDKVVTYTGTKGTIGERDIVTTIGTGDGLTTVGTVKTELDNKQKKVQALPATNVVTYTGTNEPSSSHSPGRGNMTVTPIYDDTVNTFQNGLVRAETLNEAVAEGVRKSLIGVGPDGVTPSDTPMFWRVNSNFTDVLPTTANLPANIAGVSSCYRRVQTSETYTVEVDQGRCSDTMFNNKMPNRGDWGVVFPYRTGITYDNDECVPRNSVGNYCYKEVHGISACTDTGIGPMGSIVPSTNTTLINKLETAYEAGKTGATANGKHCYCKMTEPMVGGSRWVYTYANDDCTSHCVNMCSYDIMYYQSMRSGIFGAAAE